MRLPFPAKRRRYTLSLLLSIALSSTLSRAQSAPEAVTHRGVVYVSLGAVARLMGGEVGFRSDAAPLGLQPVRLRVGNREWRLVNGGDRIEERPGRREVPLERPVLVIDGGHYLALAEAGKLIGFEVAGAGGTELRSGEETLKLQPQVIDVEADFRRVTDLRAIHEARRATAVLHALRSLPDPTGIEIGIGTQLLCRREVDIDGMAYVVATDSGPSLASYLVNRRDIDAATEPDTSTSDYLRDRITWFREQAREGLGLMHGPRQELNQAACLTVDLCWSLRRMESDLFSAIRKAGTAAQPAHATIFLSGRWVEQHPVDMRTLLALAEDPAVRLTWGLHSFVHPKSGGFMNELSVADVRADTLRLEHLLLEYGIVPTVFYRFPGLIHDADRLGAILDLDLLPIDCDAWMAIAARGQGGPFGNPVRDGSLILVHGNGNEPEGIPPLLEWLHANPTWRLAPIEKFLSPGP